MALFDEFLKYRDCYGMNELTTNGVEGDVSQNGALFTFEYLICLLEDETISPDVKDLELKRLFYVYRSLEVLPGLSRRTPDSDEGDSMDNTGPNLAFSVMFSDSNFARNMLAHGDSVQCDGLDDRDGDALTYYPIAWILNGFKKPKRFWNNTRPTKFCLWGWFGRSPGMMAMLEMCATGKTSLFGNFAILVSQFIGCFKNTGDTDARKLPYVTWYYLVKHRGGWFWHAAYWLWCLILKLQYKNGMRDVYSIYYGDPNHPIRKYSKVHF
jgi:hypothetical protein